MTTDRRTVANFNTRSTRQQMSRTCVKILQIKSLLARDLLLAIFWQQRIPPMLFTSPPNLTTPPNNTTLHSTTTYTKRTTVQVEEIRPDWSYQLQMMTALETCHYNFEQTRHHLHPPNMAQELVKLV